MRRALLSLVALLLSGGCIGLRRPPPTSHESAATYVLRYRFTPDMELRYVLRSGFSLTTSGENPRTLSGNHEVEFRRKVIEVLPDGSARVAVAFDRLRFVTSGPGEEVMRFDSDDPYSVTSCPEEMKGIAFLTGKEIEIEQRPSGKVVGVSGLASLYKRAMAELPPDERQSLERFLRELTFKPSGLLGLDVVFPGQPVRVGESWLVEEGPFPVFCGHLAYDCHCSLQTVTRSQALVEFKGNLETAETESSTEMRQLRRVTVQGTVTFDLDERRLTRMLGESSLFLSIGGTEQSQTRTTWDLSLQRTQSDGETDARNEVR
jgi:hypothetical protein